MGKSTRKRIAAKKPRTTVVKDAAAIRTLASPLRMEIIQAFANENERLTVGEIARRVAKPRGSLYYHVRQLARIGVLVEVDTKLVGRRPEAVYKVAAERLTINTDPSSRSGRDAATRLVLSMLRQAGREFETALATGLLDARKGAQVGFRQRVRLTDADAERVEALFSRIQDICRAAGAKEKGRAYAVTGLVVPLAPEDPATD